MGLNDSSDSESIRRIDNFIKKMDDGDIEFTEKAILRYSLHETKSGIINRSTEKDSGTLSDLLSKALADYQQNKNSLSSYRHFYVIAALEWINRAWATCSVKPSDGIYRKYEEAIREKITALQEQKKLESHIQQISADYLKCEGRCEQLEKENTELRMR